MSHKNSDPAAMSFRSFMDSVIHNAFSTELDNFFNPFELGKDKPNFYDCINEANAVYRREIDDYENSRSEAQCEAIQLLRCRFETLMLELFQKVMTEHIMNCPIDKVVKNIKR